MKNVRDMLIGLPDGFAVRVKFSNGKDFLIADCDPVGEAVYGSSDFVTAQIIKVYASTARYSPGTMLEFSVNDIDSIVDPVDGSVLFQKP